jgi:hypothetical protein
MGLTNGNPNIVYMVSMDDGHEPDGNHRLPRIYMELVEGESLEGKIKKWSMVRKP